MGNSETILAQLSSQLEGYLNTQQQSVLWVGFSGGLDSTVLLHGLAQLNLSPSICAIHVNHQLSDKAAQWQSHCERVCDGLGIPLRVETVAVVNTGKGLEEAARQARYQAFEKHLAAGDLLLLGHHMNDQMETLLYRLMRGTGLSGLVGIRSAREVGKGKLVRPLLQLERSDLLAYAQESELTWIEDDSNQDLRFDRNYLRHQVLPILQSRWPKMARQWQTTTGHIQEAEQLLKQYAKEDLSRLGVRPEKLGESIDLAVFSSLSVVRQAHIVRYWVQRIGLETPEKNHLDQLSIFTSSEGDQQPQVDWPSASLRRFNNRLYLLPKVRTELPTHGHTVVNEKFKAAGGSFLEVPGLLGWRDMHNIEVRYRKGGERCKPLDRAHSQTLKKLFQEYQVEPWLRDQTPLLYIDGELTVVGDYFVCESSFSHLFEGEQLNWYFPPFANNQGHG